MVFQKKIKMDGEQHYKYGTVTSTLFVTPSLSTKCFSIRGDWVEYIDRNY